jgi:hypothetical protein
MEDSVMSYELRDLYNQLKVDAWRKTNPFSDDIKVVHDLLFDPFATEFQRVEQVSSWLQKFQPCLFGRIAAARDWLHFCLLTDKELREKSDQDIARIIQRALLAWKRRSLQPSPGFSTPAFGFVLIAASQILAGAAPDEHLKAFADKLLQLWGSPKTVEKVSGEMHWETLYLKHPDKSEFVRFTFSVDFFSAQGDNRWWHDHRSPGGLMFTANSVGHMQKYREWYEGKKDQQDWVLQTAMLTIAGAAKTKYGTATWLRSLDKQGAPVVGGVACPFSKPNQLKPSLVGKDWTRYAGWLHTDHAIRPEFFHLDAAPLNEISTNEYLEDFMYLYDPKVQDYLRFVQGEPVAQQEVTEILGSVDDWKEVYRTPSNVLTFAIKPEDEKRIDALLQRGRKWRLSREELHALG